jgi:hypothetical protein
VVGGDVDPSGVCELELELELREQVQGCLSAAGQIRHKNLIVLLATDKQKHTATQAHGNTVHTANAA